MRVKGFGNCPVYGHWVSLCGEIAPDKLQGFVYLVHCKETHKWYIGKKNFFSELKKKVAGSTRRKKIKKPSGWESYETSSDYIHDDIQMFGKDKFEFYIVQTYATKGGLTYAEANLQHKLDVMVKRLDSANRLFYNAQVEKIRFIPKEFYPEAEQTILKILKNKGTKL